MEDARVEPILTAEQWAEAVPNQNAIIGYAIADSGLGGIVEPGFGSLALAALCLHGYFTWEDVDAIRECLDLADFPDDYPRADAALNKLAALLRPREP